MGVLAFSPAERALGNGPKNRHRFIELARQGSPEVLLPTSGVSYVDRTTVYLLLDKRHVESQSAGQDAQPLSNSVAAGEQARTHPWWQFWKG